jgi:hypothetical protein
MVTSWYKMILMHKEIHSKRIELMVINSNSFWKNNQAAISWSWSKGTDGAVLGPIPLIFSSQALNVKITVLSSSGVSKFKYISRFTNGTVQEIVWDTVLTIQRYSCNVTTNYSL